MADKPLRGGHGLVKEEKDATEEAFDGTALAEFLSGPGWEASRSGRGCSRLAHGQPPHPGRLVARKGAGAPAGAARFHCWEAAREYVGGHSDAAASRTPGLRQARPLTSRACLSTCYTRVLKISHTIQGLTHCGSVTHPEGGMMGASGHNAERILLTDWAEQKYSVNFLLCPRFLSL
jgi:hypothetical protein